MSESVLRSLPAVGRLLEEPEIAALLSEETRDWLVRLVQRVVDAERARLVAAGGGGADRDALARRCVEKVLAERARLLGPSLRRVVNATGVLVHTNLGRAPWPERAIALATAAARHPLDLEIDLAGNRRGHRGRGVEDKLALLTGAEDALVVNNNAAALWLAVRATAGAGRVLLSRGEVVAIGGSFRMDEILRETGCELAEVGATNRTRPDDYRRALRPGAVVLKVHRSNFTQSGFVESVPLDELAELCRGTGHVLVYDAGSGQLADLDAHGLPGHRALAADVAAGPDLVTCSGDKLLGGCQAGIVLGRADLVASLRDHPLRRALRVDKTTLAALDGVLSHYLAGDHFAAVPVLSQLARGEAELEAGAVRLRDALADAAPPGWRAEVVAGESQVGGGCSAEALLPTRLVRWTGPHAELERCHLLLRGGDPAVLARIGQEGLAVDVRSLREDDYGPLETALRAAWVEIAGDVEVRR